MTENVILYVRKSWWSEIGNFFVAFIFIVASMGVTLFLPDIIIPIIHIHLKYALPVLFFASSILLIISSVIDYYGEVYVLTDKRAIHRVGLISRHEKSVLYNQVTDIELNQGFVGKIFGIGSIYIETPEVGVDMVIDNVKNPAKVYDIVNNYVMGQEK